MEGKNALYTIIAALMCKLIEYAYAAFRSCLKYQKQEVNVHERHHNVITTLLSFPN